MTEKVEVNGDGPAPGVRRAGAGRRPGAAGPATCSWNFEKFLLDGDGTVVARFDPTVVPDDPRVTAAVESVLA